MARNCSAVQRFPGRPQRRQSEGRSAFPAFCVLLNCARCVGAGFVAELPASHGAGGASSTIRREPPPQAAPPAQSPAEADTGARKEADEPRSDASRIGQTASMVVGGQGQVTSDARRLMPVGMSEPRAEDLATSPNVAQQLLIDSRGIGSLDAVAEATVVLPDTEQLLLVEGEEDLGTRHGHHLEVLLSSSSRRVTVANKTSPYLGYWESTYGKHGKQILRVGVETNSGQIKALKVTGDNNVPANSWSWQTFEPLAVGGSARGSVRMRANTSDPQGFSEVPVTVYGLTKDTLWISGMGDLGSGKSSYNQTFHRYGSGSKLTYHATEDIGLNLPLNPVDANDVPGEPCKDRENTGLLFLNGSAASCTDLASGAFCDHATFGDRIRTACVKSCGRCYIEKMPRANCSDDVKEAYPQMLVDSVLAECKELTDYCKTNKQVLDKCKRSCGLCGDTYNFTVNASSNESDTGDATQGFNETTIGDATNISTNTTENLTSNEDLTTNSSGSATTNEVVANNASSANDATKTQSSGESAASDNSTIADDTAANDTIMNGTNLNLNLTTTPLPEPYKSMVGCSRRRQMGVCATRRRRIV